MNADNQGMRLRQRRTVLGDISSRTLNVSSAASVAVERPLKKLKRSRIDGDDDDLSLRSKKVAPISKPEVVATLTAKESSCEQLSRKNKNSFGGRETVLGILPVHVINRSLPLHAQGAEPGQCLDIIDRMYNIYYELEEEFSAKPYMFRQKDINQKMRMILVDWLIEIHTKYKLQAQTLWLTVNILDRYLEKEQILRSRLQLVGVSALLIASKFEEIYPPEVKDCVYVTDYAYNREDVLLMETAILTRLEYKISVPTGYHFLSRYLNCIKASTNTRLLASYYAERNLQEMDMLCVQPHKFAAAALYAALIQQSDYIDDLSTATVWTRALQEESGCCANDLEVYARIIVSHVNEDPQTASRRRLVAVKNKYASKICPGISTLPLPCI